MHNNFKENMIIMKIEMEHTHTQRKSWLIEKKINKTDKSLARLKKREKEKIQITNIRKGKRGYH